MVYSGATSGGDGKALSTADHPLTNGGTFANEPTVAEILTKHL